MRLLAVFAHPDDESFICGGTLAKAASEGNDVRLVCATRGEEGEITHPGIDPDRYPKGEARGRFRAAELESACAVMGVSPRSGSATSIPGSPSRSGAATRGR